MNELETSVSKGPLVSKKDKPKRFSESWLHRKGLKIAEKLEREPKRIVKLFYYALEEVNQHDLCRIVEKAWTDLTKTKLFDGEPIK